MARRYKPREHSTLWSQSNQSGLVIPTALQDKPWRATVPITGNIC